MIIVYISLAVIGGAVLYLLFTAIGLYKNTKPAIERLNAVTVSMQAQMDKIKSETNELTATQQSIQADIAYKKAVFKSILNAAKQTPNIVKKWWNIKIPYIQK